MSYMLIGSRPKLELLSDNFKDKVDNIPIERVCLQMQIKLKSCVTLFS